MKYVSLDIETTGLIHDPLNVLSLALVVEDTENPLPLESLPALKLLFTHEPWNYQDTALAMNAKVFAARALVKGHVKDDRLEGLVGMDIADGARQIVKDYIVCKSSWGSAFNYIATFLEGTYLKKPTLAGKNIKSFDWKFLPDDVKTLFNGKFLDPGQMYKTSYDQRRPSMAECCLRAGLSDFVAHDAYEDALLVIDLIRRAQK